MVALQTVPGQVLGEKRKEVAAVKRQPKARPVFLLVRRCAGRAKRTKAAVVAMEIVEKVMERGVTEGAMEKMIEAPTVRRERIEPAYKVEVVSDEVAIRGEVEDPLAGNGGCSTKTDRNKAV
jgi:hypothetical protein